MRFFLIICIGLSGFLLSGCLTVSRGTTEAVNVISKPTGANVEAELLLQSGNLDTNNKNGSKVLSCNPTPCSVEIPRKSHARITVSKEGFNQFNSWPFPKGARQPLR